jgi:predicted amidophosphoribosyltransferase
MPIVVIVLLIFLGVGAFSGIMAALASPPGGWLILLAIGVFIVGGSFLVTREQRRKEKAVAQRRKLAELETDAGVPLLEDTSTCVECGKTLLVGARFCSYCRTPSKKALLGICSVCGARNQEDASWCSQCGEALNPKEVKSVISAR